MIRSILGAVVLAATTRVSAEPTTVFIPGKTWVLTFDIGLVNQYQAKSTEQQFQYAASADGVAASPRTILSFYLETQASESKQACYRVFWTKAASNPLIDVSSVRHTSYANYEQVVYRLQNGQPNANFYFVNDGNCADVHISLSKAMPLSEEALIGFGKALRW